MTKLSGVLVIALVFGCVLAYGVYASDVRTIEPTAIEATITLEGTSVRYVGRITDQNVDRLLDMVDGVDVTQLIISSGGGEINAGMRMGEWVYDHQIDIVVECMCMSSCANYVFPAARQKTIKENSIVAWHGNALQKSGLSDEDIRATVIEAYENMPEIEQETVDLEVMIDQAIQNWHDYMASSKASQAQFFEKIGVDEYVCRVGQDCGIDDFFCLSVEDMANFGITNVTAPDDYENTDLTPYQKNDHSVEFIHLD